MSTSGFGKCKRKNALGNRTDVGWEHGIDVDNNSKKVKCKYCNKVFSGGIYRFKNHLAGTRKDVEECKQVPNDVKKQMIVILMKSAEASAKKRKEIHDIADEEQQGEEQESALRQKGQNIMGSFVKKSASGIRSTQTTINQLMERDLREECYRQIARFFYTSAIPFKCVKNPEFVKMLELVSEYGCGFKPPLYYEIREKYLKQEVALTMDLLEEYKVEWKKTGCSIMADGWKDKKKHFICNFMVNSPKGTIFLSSVGISDISKTAEKVFEMLNEIVEKIGEENVVQVVTDNAANYKAAGEMLMEKRKKLYWTPCVAHCIDLILEDFEKKIRVHNVTIAQGRKVTTYIYSRTMLISMLRHFTKGRDLIRPAMTRFATAYLTLGCLSDLKTSLMTMFTSKQWKTSRFAKGQDGKRIQQVVLDNKFWRDVSSCLKAAYPLIKVLRMVDLDEKPAMGFIYKEMDNAKEKIKINFNNVKKRYDFILKIIDERWELQPHRPLHVAAYYLNPHYHYSSDFRADAEIKIGLYRCLERMVPDPMERHKIDMQLEEFKDAKGLFGIETAKMARDKKPPAKWWDSYGDQCPELKKFAIRVLSLTCSSSGFERNWSAFEMVHAKRRNCLHQKNMNDLVFVMYNLKLRNGQTKKDALGSINVDDLSSDDEWITEEDLNPSNKDWLGVLDSAVERDECVDVGEGESVTDESTCEIHDVDNVVGTSKDLEIDDFDNAGSGNDGIGGDEIGGNHGDSGNDDDSEANYSLDDDKCADDLF